jgi:hypothetical protein
LKQALLAMMTLPGIPVLYYGTEQGWCARGDVRRRLGLGRARPLRHAGAAVPLHPVVALIVDGDPTRAQRVRAGTDGRFTARIDTRRMSDPTQVHRVVARALPAGADAPAPEVVGNALNFRVALPWQTLADVPQPPQAGGGPEGTYRYPTHESYTRQMDLQRTRVLAAGGALRIELEMADLTRVWGPANGFDHVAFSIFIELPGEDGGARVMPGQNAELPEGMRWHRRLRAHGWSNALFGPEGASATADGRSITPAAAIETDASQRRVVFTIPSEALGDPAGLQRCARVGHHLGLGRHLAAAGTLYRGRNTTLREHQGVIELQQGFEAPWQRCRAEVPPR